MPTLKAVLFDLDGTLLDTAPDFTHAINYVRNEHNLSPLPETIIRTVVSNGARALAALGFPEKTNPTEVDDIHQQLLTAYADNLVIDTRFFDGIETLLNFLESTHLKWGIVTNKPLRFTQPLLEQLQLAHRCSTIICPDHVKQSKPDPEGLLLACKEIDCEPSETIYVGDHARDIIAGKNANMSTIAALYGYIDNMAEFKQSGANFYAETPHEITEIIAEQLDQSKLD